MTRPWPAAACPGQRTSWAEISISKTKHLLPQALSGAFGDGPLDRVYIDTLSSVSYSFGTFDIDALQNAALWLGGEEGQYAFVQPVDASLRDSGAESDLPQGECLKYEPRSALVTTP